MAFYTKKGLLLFTLVLILLSLAGCSGSLEDEVSGEENIPALETLAGCNGFLADEISGEENTPALETTEFANIDPNGMILDLVYEVFEGNGCSYYHDPITDGMFLWRRSAGAGGLTQMLDPETGMPLTYAKFIEYYDAFMADNRE